MNLQRINFSIIWMANKLNVTRSAYYAWLHLRTILAHVPRKKKNLVMQLPQFLKTIRNAMARFEFIRSCAVKGLALVANAWLES